MRHTNLRHKLRKRHDAGLQVRNCTGFIVFMLIKSDDKKYFILQPFFFPSEAKTANLIFDVNFYFKFRPSSVFKIIIFHSTEDNKFKGCLAANLNPKCSAIQRSAMVSQDVIRALDSISLSKRLFCGPVEAVNADSFHRSAKELANCRPEFFKSAETCAKPFREVYSKASSKKSPGVCR